MFYSRPYLSVTYQDSSIVGYFPAFPAGTKESDAIICSYIDNSGGSAYYRKMRPERYVLFNKEKGVEFEKGRITLEDLGNLAVRNGEPGMISGKQEPYEAILNMYI